MDNTNLYDKIDDYLDGLLSESERAEMDAVLAQDPVFARNLELHRAEREALTLLSEDQARADFLRWTAETTGSESPQAASVSWWHRFRWLPVLVVVGVGLVAYFRFFQVPEEARPTPQEPAAPAAPAAPKPGQSAPQQPVAEAPKPPKPKPQSLPADDFDAATEEVLAAVTEVESLFSGPSDAAFRTRSGGKEPDPESPFAKGVKALQEAQSAADYRLAAGLFGQVDSSENRNLALAAAYLQAHAWFHLGRHEEAANAFQRVFLQRNGLYFRDAKWKEALCLYAAMGEELRQNLVVLNACQSGTGSCGKYYDRLRVSLLWVVDNYPAQAQKAGQLLERLEK